MGCMLELDLTRKVRWVFGYSSIVSLFAFGAAILLTFKRPRVRLPFRQVYIQLDYGLAPILWLFFLLHPS